MSSTRPDRKEKLLERKILDETVVKCCLRKLLLPGARVEILQAVRERVVACSKRTHIASLVLNLALKEAFDGVPDEGLSVLALPEVLNQTFVRQAMVGTEGAEQPYETIASLLDRHPLIKEKLDMPRHPADRNIYSAASKKLLTNLKTHLVTNFHRLMKKVIYSDRFKELLAEAGIPYLDAGKAMLYSLNNWKVTEDQELLLETLPQEIRESLGLQRQILGGANIHKTWLKGENNQYRLLRYFAYVNRFLERHGQKVYSMAPICSIKNHFITIDTHSLYGVAKDAGLLGKKTSGAAFVALRDEQWGSILATQKVAGKGKKFTETIDTDGVAVCAHFTKRKTVKEEGKPGQGSQINPNADVIGVDPGRSNILYAVQVTEKGPKSYRLTRSHYYRQSGMLAAQKTTELWQKAVRPQITRLSEVSPKGVSLTKFRDYLAVVWEVYDDMWAEHLHPKWANQRLRLYGGKKRTFARFLNQLVTPGKETVLAFGSAKFAPGGKGEVSVPTSRAFKECSYRFKTVHVDEFRSTRVYNGDKETVLQDVKRKSDGRKVRGLLWCRSTNRYGGKLINRDLNGALNIRDCLLLAKRPPMLKRGGSKLKVTVGKIIKC